MPITEEVSAENVQELKITNLVNAKLGSKVSGRIIVPPATEDRKGHEIDFILKKITPLILTWTDFDGNTFDYEPSTDGQIKRVDLLDPIPGVFVLESVIGPEESKTSDLIQGTATSVEESISDSRIRAKEYIYSLREGNNLSLRSNSNGTISCFIVESELKTREGEKFSYIKLRSNNPANANKYAIIISSRGVFPD